MRDKFLYLLPIGNVDYEIVDALTKRLDEKFGLPSKVLQGLDEPSYAYNEKRRQYFSTAIIKVIIENTPEDALRIIGVTEVDLYTPGLNFIFGEAQLNGKAALISTHRLRQEFYSLPSNYELLIERTTKEAIHELGHTFSLTHCSLYSCVMSFSNSIRDVDTKTDNFCENCSSMLRRKLEYFS